MKYMIDSELVERLGYDKDDPCARLIGADGQPVLAPHGTFGKWCMSGVPKTGWDYVADEVFQFVPSPTGDGRKFIDRDGDVQTPTRRPDGTPYNDWPVCEMCEKAKIIWIHRVEHPDYPRPLDCGKCCASNMVRDLAKAERLEKEAKGFKRSRRIISDQAEWRGDNRRQQAIVGSLYLTVQWNGRPCALGGYTGRVWHRPSGYMIPNIVPAAGRAFKTMRQAKAAVIDAATEARREKPWYARADYETRRRAFDIPHDLYSDGPPPDGWEDIPHSI